MTTDNFANKMKTVYEENLELVKKHNDLVIVLNKLLELRKSLKTKSQSINNDRDLFRLLQVYVNEEGKILDTLISR